ncbi:YugN-like family protein [Evansella caseinilytica]|uniref:YugN-like family protein n=1 Tax=Evansella caseinilytica TaxID=1503961 RepID=A0A1H3MLY6_9BACI|nr:YugN family protein [Evansella caseinilytica]SDY77155.1 YugN-like family protein [Evansella caseinilytica]
MIFEETGLENVTIEFQALEEIMESAGFHYVYDYERITFDYKMVDKVRDDVYYFRVQGYAVEGEIPSPHSAVKIFQLLLGKHYYPHGVEYDEEFPKNIVEKCKKKISIIKEQIQSEAVS